MGGLILRYLLDANACIEVLRHPDGPVAQRMNFLMPREAALPVPVVAELLIGARRQRNTPAQRQAVDNFMAMFECVPFITADAQVAGTLGARMLDIGKKIGAVDLQIAAMAVRRNLLLVTHNIGEFSRIEELILEDWQTS